MKKFAIFLFLIVIIFSFFISTNSGEISEDIDSSVRFSQYVPGEIIISLKDRGSIKIQEFFTETPDLISTNLANQRDVAEINTLLDKYNAVFIKDLSFKPSLPILTQEKNLISGYSTNLFKNIKKIKILGDVDSAIEEFQKLDLIEYAEPNYLFNLSFVPNDPLFVQQWAHENTQASAGWDIEKGSSDAIIAILDTGVDWQHEDLSENIWVNQDELPNNGVDDDNNG